MTRITKYGLIFFLQISLFVSVTSCTEDDTEIDYRKNLFGKTWIKHSFIDYNMSGNNPQEFYFKDEYNFYEDGTYSITTLGWRIDSTIFVTGYDTIVNTGIWLFNESKRIMDFTDTNTVNHDDLLFLDEPIDWYIVSMDENKFVAKYIFDPYFEINYKVLFKLK